jgi:plasmid stabilization system protein ParE
VTRRHLIVRSLARADILRYVRYLLEQGARAAAERFPNAVEQALERLMDMPGMGTPQTFTHPKLGAMRACSLPTSCRAITRPKPSFYPGGNIANIRGSIIGWRTPINPRASRSDGCAASSRPATPNDVYQSMASLRLTSVPAGTGCGRRPTVSIWSTVSRHGGQ